MMKSQTIRCTACNEAGLKSLLSFGNQPPSNQFYSGENEAENQDSYLLSLGKCPSCQMVQLVDRMPIEVMRPKYDWLSYNEPEGHLDSTVSILHSLPGITRNSQILGLTYKDQSSLDRLSRLGHTYLKCVSTSDLEVNVNPFGLETVQMQLSKPKVIEGIREKYGLADLILVRHILEHSPSAKNLLESISSLVRPGGFIMLELPDSEKTIRFKNYPFIWEEHFSYFTENAIKNLASLLGFHIHCLEKYPYAYEDSLVVILQTPVVSHHALDAKEYSESVMMSSEFSIFVSQFNQVAEGWRRRLKILNDQGEKIAIFGAGHLAVKFLNFYDLAKYIECAIDDHPNKINLSLPGSGLKIKSSSYLADSDIKYCISTLSPESELKVRSKLAKFFECGGQFLQAFNTALDKGC